MGYWIVIPMTNHGDGVNGPEVPYNSVPVILSSFFKFFIILCFFDQLCDSAVRFPHCYSGINDFFTGIHQFHGFCKCLITDLLKRLLCHSPYSEKACQLIVDVIGIENPGCKWDIFSLQFSVDRDSGSTAGDDQGLWFSFWSWKFQASEDRVKISIVNSLKITDRFFLKDRFRFSVMCNAVAFYADDLVGHFFSQIDLMERHDHGDSFFLCHISED